MVSISKIGLESAFSLTKSFLLFMPSIEWIGPLTLGRAALLVYNSNVNLIKKHSQTHKIIFSQSHGPVKLI